MTTKWPTNQAELDEYWRESPMPKKLILFVKAETFRQVKEAGIAHKIHLSDIAASSTTTLEFRCRTDEKNLLTVQKWFNEEAEPSPGFGFPVGTLLFFRSES